MLLWQQKSPADGPVARSIVPDFLTYPSVAFKMRNMSADNSPSFQVLKARTEEYMDSKRKSLGWIETVQPFPKDLYDDKTVLLDFVRGRKPLRIAFKNHLKSQTRELFSNVYAHLPDTIIKTVAAPRIGGTGKPIELPGHVTVGDLNKLTDKHLSEGLGLEAPDIRVLRALFPQEIQIRKTKGVIIVNVP